MENVFEELNNALQEFKTFLDTNVTKIQPAIQLIAGLIPEINTMINQVIALLKELETEINKLDPSAIPGLDEVTSMAERTTRTLAAARDIIPSQSGTIDEVTSIARKVGGLSALGDVKQEILDCLAAIITHFESLKAADSN